MNTGTSFNITGVSFEDPVKGIITLADGNCGLSVDSGKTWTALPTGNSNPLTCTHIMPGKWFVAGNTGTILLSTNNGGSWVTFNTGTTQDFNAIHLSSPTVGHAVGKGGVIHLYNGSGFTQQTSGTTENLNGIFEFSNGTAFAVGDNQTLLYYNGTSWSPKTSPINLHIKDIRFTDLLHGYMVGTGGNILQTTDGGNTWVIALAGVGIDFNSVDVIGNTAWATGTNGIVYQTNDNGANWIRYSVGYTGSQAQLRVVPSGKGHVVGAGGHGRYFLNTADTSTTSSINSIGDKILNGFNIFPNPTTGKFTLTGFVSNEQNITVELKNAEGKLIHVLNNYNFSGDYKENFNAEFYAPGVYFLHIKVGENCIVKRLVIDK
jgi:photosystem II stability/assembly factor-like uncharacterized protein